MTYLDEVLGIFVDDISNQLDVDLSWTLDRRSENLFEASSQYRDELRGVLLTKSGGHNQNPNRQGNLFEVRDVFVNNLSEAISNSDVKYATADYLYALKQQGVILSPSIANAANYNDNATDVIAFAKGKILESEKAQYKSIKNFAQLSTKRYLENNAKLVIPLEDFEKAKIFWQKRADIGDIDAEEVLKKITAGKITRNSVSLQGSWVEAVVVSISDENKAKDNLQNLADLLITSEAELTYTGSYIANKAVVNGKDSLKQALAYMVSRCISEIRQAWGSGQSVDFTDRIQHIIHDTKAEFKDVFEQDIMTTLSKVVVDYLLGLVSNFFKGIYQSIQKGGKYFKLFCEELWSFVTGETDCFLNAVVNICKAISGLAIVAFSVGINQYLSSIGVPDTLVIVLTAFITALLSVSIFRLIENSAKIVGSIFYSRDIARVRRQEVERICDELLPIIEEKVAYLDVLIEHEDTERQELFNSSFIQIQKSLSSTDLNQIIQSYCSLYQYLGKSLPFSNECEFDAFIKDKSAFKL